MPHDRNRRLRRGQDDLHGNVPDQSQVVLLLIDILNDLNFPDNRHLVRRSVALAKSIAKLKTRCKKLSIPTIYVNDNRGRWRSDISAVLRHCLRTQSPGRKMTKLLVPEPDDYIVLKPKHSPFYASPLQTILDYDRCSGCDCRRRNNECLRPDRRWRTARPGFRIVRAGGLCGCPHRARTPTLPRRHEE